MAIGSIASAAQWQPLLLAAGQFGGIFARVVLQPTRSSSLIPSPWLRHATARAPSPARDTILDDPQMRKQFKMLEYHADPGAQFRQIGLGIVDLDTVQDDLPAWNGSSALTHFIKVDFPEPRTHTTHHLAPATRVVQSFRPETRPVPLSTWLISIMKFSLAGKGDAGLQAPDAEGCDTGNGE